MTATDVAATATRAAREEPGETPDADDQQPDFKRQAGDLSHGVQDAHP